MTRTHVDFDRPYAILTWVCIAPHCDMGGDTVSAGWIHAWETGHPIDLETIED